MTRAIEAPEAPPGGHGPDDPAPQAHEGVATMSRSAALFIHGAGAVVFGIGVVVLVAWITGHGPATSLPTTGQVIQPNTALGFALLGLALQVRATRVAAAFACGAALIGTITGVEYLVGWEAGIDNILIASSEGNPPGRMAPNSAIVLAVAGLVLCARRLKRAHPLMLASGGSLLSGLSAVALVGYMTGLEGAYLWGGATAMAAGTAVAGALVGLAMVVEARAWYRRQSADAAGAWAPVPVGIATLTVSIVLWQATVAKGGDTIDLATASWIVLALAVFLTSVIVVALELRQKAVAARRRAEAAERALAASASDLERSIVELQRSNRELEDFAFIASHDLQEPLRVVAGYVQLLERRYKGRLDDEADEFIAFAVDGANRMKQLIQDLLTYSRVGTTGRPFAQTDLQAVAARSLATLTQALEDSGGTVTLGTLPTVSGDASQLEQLVTNLLGNALKFASPDRPPVVEMGATRIDGGWEVSVSDNGIGIPAQHRERVFRMFQRLHGVGEYPGTGIGLAVAHRIVVRHGGEIWVSDAHAGHGTTICFTLPDVSPPEFGANHGHDPLPEKEPRT